jgi:hypothetical protein
MTTIERTGRIHLDAAEPRCHPLARPCAMGAQCARRVAPIVTGSPLTDYSLGVGSVQVGAWSSIGAAGASADWRAGMNDDEALLVADNADTGFSNHLAALKKLAEVVRRQHAEIEQLRDYGNALNARCIADAPDAERYRWLRDTQISQTGFSAREADEDVDRLMKP